MSNKVTCFIPLSDKDSISYTIASLKKTGLADKIFIVSEIGNKPDISGTDIRSFSAAGFASTESIKKMVEEADSEYILVYSKAFPLDPGRFALDRMIQVCEDTGAGMVYSGYFENKENKLSAHPVIDYQEGSLRDDFNFGSLILYNASAFKAACARMKKNFRFAGFYDLRLKISQTKKIIHVPELLYTEIETDLRKTGEKQFDYVDPRNREVQIEMEIACTEHLKRTGAFLKPVFEKISFNTADFKTEATVIIPVKNRVKTISDAINSVLTQKTGFEFNLIVVDNYSTDGTTEIIRNISGSDRKVIHVIPERKDLGIGGCWNEGVFHPLCGKFAIQLDSDDLYINNNVISKIVNAFYEQQCAMVVGSYKMVNFDLQEIPPGLIDHKEWTPGNGRNNALRINGLGAPRAFYTPVLRKIRVPNVSYGEDYAVGLAISRNYQIGRIYEPLYLCRRWEENSDAALDVARSNMHNLYKDKIRTIELHARKQLVRQRKMK